jgi:class 3 adenylate cyclase
MIAVKLGPYELIEEIGRGGMAAVYRAYQSSMERMVAIKVILTSIARDESTVQRFQREARLIARLEHPHILPVYDFDGGHEPPYIVMRCLDGGTLKEVLEQGSLPPAEAGYLLRQVGSALDYAHRQGIIHRDIKPSNIMIDREGNTFVTDFGIARIAAREEGERQITATGVIVGTPDYMSPEQARGVDDIDHRADIYALGVILFQMLTGRLPFAAPTTMGVLMKHIQETIPSVLALKPDLPPAMDEVISKALAKNPADRYASANELVLALTATLGDAVTTAPAQLQAATGQSIILRQQFAARGQKAEADSTPIPSEQQKQVTVLYANLAELMEIVEEEVADPLVVRQSLWQQLDGIIADYGGLIDNHTGDTVLALWGVQSVSEDDPERAVRAALAMREEVRAGVKNYSFSLQDDEPLPMQIGLHTGVTLLTRTTTPPSTSGGGVSASGATVNMATRLERAAPAGSIVISAETYNYVRGVFLVEGLAPVRLRGGKEPVELYLVNGVKPRTFRQATPAVEGIETKLIGREAELKLLIEAMETAAEDEETQVVTLVAEAGLGKTRLLYELNEWEDKQEGDFWYFPAYTTPQMVNQPFGLFRELLSYRFEIQDSDSLTVAQDKFERGVAAFMGPNTGEQAHLMAHLLGITFPDSPYLRNKDPQQLNNLGQKYLTDFFIAASQSLFFPNAPALGAWLELENIHWADDRSLDFVNHLVENRPNLSLVITCTARPSLFERRPTWGSGQDFHQRLDLRPLSKRDSRKLVKEILQKVDSLPDEVREGNPFYMEELVKMLIEDRVILKGEEKWLVEAERLAQARVPGTLTGLLQARLDSLLPEERVTLQRAAVVGRVFWAEALKALQAADQLALDVDHALAVLARRELISLREETTFEGRPEYIFKSTMLRDVTYDSILKRQQRAYHAAVGYWLVSIVGARAGEYNLLIAEHYEMAGENVLAAEYLHRAGEQAVAIGAFPEAIGLLERGLKLIEGQAQPEVRPLQAGLHYHLGAVYVEQGQYAIGDEHLADSLSLARELGDKKGIIEALGSLGQSASKQGHHEAAKTYLQEALNLAREAGDKAKMAFALMWLGSTEGYQQEYQQADTYLLEALSLAREAGAQTLAARALNILGENARNQVKYVEAVPYYQEALLIYRALGHQFGIALVTLNLGHVAAASGDAKTAGGHYLASLRICLDIGALSFTVEGVAGLTGLKAAGGEAERALELLGLVLHHPACDEDVRLAANPVLAHLRASLPPEVVEAGLERGRALDFDSTARALLAEE